MGKIGTFVSIELRLEGYDLKLSVGEIAAIERALNEGFKTKFSRNVSSMTRVVFSNSVFKLSPYDGKKISTLISAEFNGKLSGSELEEIERYVNNKLLTRAINQSSLTPSSAIFSAVQYKKGAYF